MQNEYSLKTYGLFSVYLAGSASATQELLERVDQQNLTIQELQQQLKVWLALKQKPSTAAETIFTQQAGLDSTPNGNTTIKVADGGAAKAGGEGVETRGHFAAIRMGDQVRFQPDHANA